MEPEDHPQASPGGNAPIPNENVSGDASRAGTEADHASAEQSGPEVLGPSEDRTPRSDRTPLFAGILLLAILIVGGVAVALNQRASSNSAAPTAAATTSALKPAPTVAVPATPSISGGSVAAVVNGHSIPTSTFRAYLDFAAKQSAGQPGVTNKVLGQQTMTQIIDNELIRQYATAHGLAVSSSDYNTQVQKIQAAQGGPQGFTRWESQLGLTPSSFKILLTASLLGQKVESRVVSIPSADARHILIGTNLPNKTTRKPAVAKAKAEQVLQQLQHGASFASLAKKYSDDTASAKLGGLLGTIYPNEMVPAFDHAVFTLPLHKPTIVQSQYGFHIVEVLSRTQHSKPPTSQTALQAYQQAQQPKFQAWLKTEASHATIKRLVTVA